MDRLFRSILFILASVFAARMWEISFLGVEAIRIGFGSLFIMLGGMYLGPWYGALIGICADISGFLLQSDTGTRDYLPQITLVHALWGALPWCLFRWRRFSIQIKDLLLTLGIPQVVLGIGAMSLIVHRSFGTPLTELVRSRSIAQLGAIPVYVMIAYALFRNRESEAAMHKSEEQYRRLVTEMQQGLALHEIICDKRGRPVDYRFVDVNDAYLQLTGLRRDVIIGKTVLQVLPKTEPYWIERFGRVALGGEAQKFENYSVELNRYYSVTAYSPAPRQFAVIVDDVTFHRRAEEKLRESEENFRQIAETVGEVFWLRNADNTEMIYINPAYEVVWGRTRDSLYQNPDSFSDSVYEEDRALVLAALAEYKTTEEFDLEYRIKRPSGELRWVHSRLVPVKDDQGKTVRHTGLAIDVTQRKRAEREIEYLSCHDALTGLYNRGFFETEWTRLDTPRNLPLTLVLLDVNGLKLTNDAFGHQAGDELLKKVAHAMKTAGRQDDIIARVGGDEFAILLPQTDEKHVDGLTRRIQQAVAQEEVSGLPVSVSVGWGTKMEQQESLVDVFKTAEEYMYRSKTSERNSRGYQSIHLIMQTLYAKSPREQTHSQRVSQLCAAMGRAMGLSQGEINELTTAGMLHDIGKVAIREGILDQARPLTDTQWVEMKKHPTIGFNILSTVNDYGPLAECVLAHHERWDGGGYPDGRKRETIPLFARLIAVADAYDAMVNDRPYRKGMSSQDAWEEIEACAGFQFDPEMVVVFLQLMYQQTKATAKHG